MAGHLAHLLKVLNPKIYLEVVALSVDGGVIKFMAANLDFSGSEDDFNSSISAVIEKYELCTLLNSNFHDNSISGIVDTESTWPKFATNYLKSNMTRNSLVLSYIAWLIMSSELYFKK